MEVKEAGSEGEEVHQISKVFDQDDLPVDAEAATELAEELHARVRLAQFMGGEDQERSVQSFTSQR